METETADAQRTLGYAYRSGNGVAQNECTSVKWFRKAAEQGDDKAQHVLSEWDITLGDVAMKWQVVYDPDPRATVVEADAPQYWTRGSSAEDEQEEEQFEGASQSALPSRMSPWVVRCELNVDTLLDKVIDVGEVRWMAEEACHTCGWDASVVTSVDGDFTDDSVYYMTLRVRLLASGGPALAGDGTTSLTNNHGAGDDTVGDRGSGSSPAVQLPEARELTVYCPDGASHKLVVSPSTTVFEVKQHVCRAVRDSGAANVVCAEEESALPFFWQDEHTAQRQHIFMVDVEDELADTRSMGSLDSPSALFLLLDTEVTFMKRLQAEAVGLRARLEGVKLRNLARCDMANTTEVEGTLAVEAAGSTGAGIESDGAGPASSKKRRVD
jgi:hypothetical protein